MEPVAVEAFAVVVAADAFVVEDIVDAVETLSFVY